jgi:hypothetical protein
LSSPASPAAGRWPWALVPREVSDQLRPNIEVVVDEVVTAVRAEVPEYDRPLEGEFGRLISQGVGVALGQFVDLIGRDAPPPDLTIYEAMGREEHRQGRTLDALQSAYRVGARVSWRHVATFGEASGMSPTVLYQLAEAIFAFIDRLAAASVAGYAEGQSRREGTLQARRQALVELLVRDEPLDEGDLIDAAHAASWPVPARIALLAVGEGDPVALARRMPEGTIAAAHAPVALLVVPDPDQPGLHARIVEALRGRRAVLGPGVGVRRGRARAARRWRGAASAGARRRARGHRRRVARRRAAARPRR